MMYRLTAILLFALGLGLGFGVVAASGVNTLLKEVLGLGVPTLAGLAFAIAWWRKGQRRDW